MVEEAATATAEEVDEGWCGGTLCKSLLSLLLLLPPPQLTLLQQLTSLTSLPLPLPLPFFLPNALFFTYNIQDF
jgi:hypothetical protein